MANNSTNKPTHFVYTVRDGGENNKDYWTKIGIAYAHKDGKGFSLSLDALPLDGKLTIREQKTKS